ncbi:hypothetical protein F5Y10DRAFT_142263 [Nemania abortiva]|nr:hypothetical protein F5Y10DRAFT_142263 [Nemania abortiva]
MVLISLGVLPKGATMSLRSIKRVDFAGNVLLVAAVTSILIAWTWGGSQYPWSYWRTLVPLVLSFWSVVGTVEMRMLILDISHVLSFVYSISDR